MDDRNRPRLSATQLIALAEHNNDALVADGSHSASEANRWRLVHLQYDDLLDQRTRVLTTIIVGHVDDDDVETYWSFRFDILTGEHADDGVDPIYIGTRVSPVTATATRWVDARTQRRTLAYSVES